MTHLELCIQHQQNKILQLVNSKATSEEVLSAIAFLIELQSQQAE